LAIPEETYRFAHAAFPKGTLCLRIDDENATGTQCAVKTCQSSVGEIPTRQLDRSSR
jgi:hypothetical protein